MINFTISQLAGSLAEHLAPSFEGVAFYEDPVQQGTDLPAMFLQTRGASIQNRMGKRFLWTLRLDLVYLLDFNLPNLQQLYQAAAQILDLKLEVFTYMDPDGNYSIVRTYNRDWTIDLDELHYRFDLQSWVTKEEAAELMRTLELNMEVRDGEEVQD